MKPTDSHALVADAVLFDMDGTLVDSNAVVNAMWTRFAQEHGHDPREVLAHAHGTPSLSTLRRFLPEDADLEAWRRRVSEWETGEFSGVVEIPGAIEFVRALPPDRWAVVTSAIAGAARVRLEGAGFPAIPVLVGADDLEHGKPSPDAFLVAASALGVEPSRCVVFEDSPAGIEAGLAAGCEVVVVGAFSSARTRGLRRLRDWRGVRVERASDGSLTISGIGRPADAG